ncbi:baseplate J/gp47 family protein [Paenibacillus paeoniae]|uniref:Baseplate J protein n=1 Tax=Paenibacillus paeoniae TaxID=2292705 RepID=A0A371PEQ1_9BACL|nr:baseplate J/gp47 family protein [Paenibacillus paeoniae]REK74392.1 baseplate J protein [Paenibacillus paeoniae]
MDNVQTMEVILERMLDRVPGSIDKREGSVIYDALAPAAAELAQLYAEMELQQRLGFGITSSGEYLELRTADFGVNRQPATTAQRKGLFYGENQAPLDIPIGSRYGGEGINYVVRERLSAGVFRMECEMPGAGGNLYYGPLLPLDFINGLVRAELSDVIVHGEDLESDDSLRARYLHRVRNPSSGGNAADYRNWAQEVPGVGGARVYPLWNGAGSVKVVIFDSQMKPAAPVLVNTTKAYIDTVRPIGAAVTVVSAAAKSILLRAKVRLADGYVLQDVTEALASSVQAYLRSVTIDSDYVSIAQIGTLLLRTQGVIDYTNLTLNGAAANVELASEELPDLTGVELEV